MADPLKNDPLDGLGPTNTKSSPFSQECLNAIFKVSDTHSDRLKSRESGRLEFKKAFSVGSLGRYARTMAAYANTKGGYIAYGVNNSPHKMVGLQDDRFERLDPEKLSEFLNQHLSPEIEWEQHIYEFAGHLFGLLYVKESTCKPVVCTKTTGGNKPDLRESEIYYRYRGRSQVIRYPELRTILDERQRAEQLLWLQHVKRIARIGVQEAGVFDLKSGKVTGPGGTFVIDESLLDKLSFIREGEFQERAGTPAVKLVGEAHPVGEGLLPPTRRIIKTRGIRTPDIIAAFLTNQRVDDPEEYIRQICYESSAYLPVYYFIKQAKLSLTEAITLIKAVPSTSQAKSRLADRLTNDKTLATPVPKTSSDAAKKKLELLAAIKGQTANGDFSGKQLKHALLALTMLERKQIKPKYHRELLKSWIDKFYGDSKVKCDHEFRRAVCFLDAALNREATLDE